MNEKRSFLKTGLRRLLSGVNVTVVRCLQWGDTGKGKIVDVLMSWADIIVRGTGGNNAGHTILYNGRKLVLHLLPSGIIGDKDAKISVIGRGTVIYPKALVDEMFNLRNVGLSHDNLKISKDAKLILPTHILEDRLKELKSSGGKIGTTGKGIGPAYSDHYARISLTVNDLLNESVFRKKLERHLLYKDYLLDYPPNKIEDVMMSEYLLNGEFYDAHEVFNFEAIVHNYVHIFAKTLRPYIVDTDNLIQTALRANMSILIEGAQGDLLSVDHGTYPFVTSSDSSLEGLVKGCALKIEDVDLDLGIIKGFMQTRVGNGSFPTEMGGEASAKHCSSRTREIEDVLYNNISINDEDEFRAGVALRQKAGEYGATTGRPRRVGYLDLTLLRHSLRRSSKNTRLVLTKLDVLSGMKTIKVCTHYIYLGDRYFDGKREYMRGSWVIVPPVDHHFLSWCKPIYHEFPGWDEDISGVRKYEHLPKNLKKIVEFMTKFLKLEFHPAIISVGPNREETIIL